MQTCTHADAHTHKHKKGGKNDKNLMMVNRNRCKLLFTGSTPLAKHAQSLLAKANTFQTLWKLLKVPLKCSFEMRL